MSQLGATMTSSVADPAPGDAARRSPRGDRGRGRAGHWFAVYGPPAGTLLAFIVAFEVVHRLEVFNPLIWPSPVTVLDAMVRQLQTEYLWTNLWVTTQESLYGFVLGAGIGALLGIGIASSKRISWALYPYVVLVQSMPRIALAPVFVAMLGFGMSSKVLSATAVCFFPTLMNVIIGLKNVEDDELALMQSLCASKVQTFVRLRLPASLPIVFAGLQVTLTLAFIGAVVAELTGSEAGIGLLIQQSASQLRMASMLGYIVWMALVSLAFFAALGLVGRRIAFWSQTSAEAIARRGM